MFLPFGRGSIVHVYKAMKNANLSTSLVQISAIDFGKKCILKYLISLKILIKKFYL